MADERDDKVKDQDEGLVPVVIDGETYMFTKAQAKMYEAQQAALEKQNREMELRLQELKPAPEPKPEPKVEDDDDAFWSNPKEYLKQELRKAREEVTSELEKKYDKEEKRKKFWDEFYKTHKHLKKHEILVNGILQRDWQEFHNMDASKAIPELGKRVDKYIEDNLTMKGSGDDVKKETFVEGVDHPAANVVPIKPESDVSMTSILRNREKVRQHPRANRS